MPPIRKSAFHVSQYRPLRGDIICRDDLNMNVLIARLDCYSEGALKVHYGLALGKIVGDDQAAALAARTPRAGYEIPRV
jgi:hypothetical protein